MQCSNLSGGKVMKKLNCWTMSIFLCFLLMVGWLAGKCSAVWAETIQETDTGLGKAILSEDWKKVADLLGSVDTETPSPVLRLIKGHACLALNRNNESLCLFLSVSTDEERKEWEKWAQDFADKNQKSAIAYYFKGDALARLKQWDDALIAFNDALKFKQNHPLVLNARGVTYAARGFLDNALTDFNCATSVNKHFADAFCSLGAIAIQQREGAKGAIEDFTNALNISPDFAVALYGLGCVESVLGNWEDAREGIENAAKKSDCVGELIRISVARMIEYINTKSEDVALAIAKGENPQMRIDANLKKINDKGAGWIGGPLNDVFNTLSIAKDPKLTDYAMHGLGEIAKNNPSRVPDIARQIGNIKGTNRLVEGLKNMFDQPVGNKHLINNYELRTELGAKGFAKSGPLGLEAGGKIGGLMNQKTFQELKPGSNLPNQWMDNSINKKKLATQFDNHLTSTLPSYKSNPQGFKTGLEEASWDEGNWPFGAVYGLFYKLDYQSTSQVIDGGTTR